MSIGVVVGRFQVASLHEGHIALLSAVAARCSRMVVLVGVRQGQFTARDPLPFFCRADAIRTVFPQATVLPLHDQVTDQRWTNQIDLTLETLNVRKATLYGGRDNCLNHYSGRWPKEVLDLDCTLSGTDVRKATELGASFEFRTGMVYANQVRFPTSYQTVDIAVVRRVQTPEPGVLLGKKPGEDRWRFPGGFVDPTDASLEAAATREAREECGGIETGQMHYIATMRIDDWRYRASDDKILTAFFWCDYIWGLPRGTDDIEDLKWFTLDLGLLDEKVMHKGHLPLARLLLAAQSTMAL